MLALAPLAAGAPFVPRGVQYDVQYNYLTKDCSRKPVDVGYYVTSSDPAKPCVPQACQLQLSTEPSYGSVQTVCANTTNPYKLGEHLFDRKYAQWRYFLDPQCSHQDPSWAVEQKAIGACNYYPATVQGENVKSNKAIAHGEVGGYVVEVHYFLDGGCTVKGPVAKQGRADRECIVNSKTGQTYRLAVKGPY